MIDEALDPASDPVMARLRAAMPADLRELPSALDPAAQALMKEITMSPTTLEHANDTHPTGEASPTVIRWDRPVRRRRLITVAAVAALAIGAVGASVAIQSGPNATSRVHAAVDRTGELNSGVARTELSLQSVIAVEGADEADDIELDFSATMTMRFDGRNSTTDMSTLGAGNPDFRTIHVDGRVYSTLLTGEWQDITGMDEQPAGVAPEFRLDTALAELRGLDGFEQSGNEIVIDVETTRYAVTAEVGDLDGSALQAFSLTPTDGDDLPSGPVAYAVWVDGDGIIKRLRAEASDATSAVTIDTTFSELGVAQTIEPPEDFSVFDSAALDLFTVMAEVPEAVFDECIPDVQNMSDLSTDEFTAVIDCFRTNEATVVADMFETLGPEGLDAAVNSVSGTD